MNTKTVTDQFGNKIDTRAGAAGIDIDATDTEGRKVNLSLSYEEAHEFITEITFMYAVRDGSIPEGFDREYVKANSINARRIYLAHEVAKEVGLHPLGDYIVSLYHASIHNADLAAVLSALFGGADDLLDD